MRSYSLSGEPGGASLSRQRQARSAWRGERLYPRQARRRRHRAGQRRARQFCATARRDAGCLAECRHRRDAGAGDAACVGGRSVDAGNLVAAWNPQRPRTSLCRRGARAARKRCPIVAAHLLQRARSAGPAQCRFRRPRASRHADASAAQPAPRRRFLHLRAVGLHERSDDRPRGRGHRAGPYPHRNVRRRRIQYAGHRGGAAQAAASAGRYSRLGADWFRLPAAASMSAGGHRSRTCSSSPRPATCRCDGRVEPGSAIPAKPGWWRARSATGPTRSTRRRMAMC